MPDPFDLFLSREARACPLGLVVTRPTCPWCWTPLGGGRCARCGFCEGCGGGYSSDLLDAVDPLTERKE